MARVRVCSDVRTSALATLGGAEAKLRARQKISRRAGVPPTRPPTPPSFQSPFRAHFLSSRCRVCLRRYGLYFMSSRRSEVLRRFCGRASDERGGFGERRQFRVFFFRLQTGCRRRRRRLRTRRRRRLETRERTSDTRRRRLLSRVVVDGFASRARALSMTRRVAVEPFKDEKARRKTKALSIGFRVTRSPTMPICALLYPPGVGRCAARERLGDAKLPGTRSRTFWDM